MPETEIVPHAPDYIDEAERLAHLVQCCGLSQEQAALRVGKSQSAVANKLRILRHSNVADRDDLPIFQQHAGRIFLHLFRINDNAARNEELRHEITSL